MRFTRDLIAVLILVFAATFVSAEVVTYDYDEIGRLRKATYGDGRSTSYTIDPAGNRLNVTTTPAPDTTPPSAPGTPTFENVGETTARARWTAATDNVGVVGYEYRVGDTGAWTPVGNVLFIDLTGLAPGITRTFYVRAVDAAPNPGPASSAPLTTLDLTGPQAPASISFSSIGETTATVSWGIAQDNVAVTSYEYRVNGGGFTNVNSAQSANLSGLSPNTRYDVDVRGRDLAGNPGALRSGFFFTIDQTAPSAPSFLNLAATGETTLNLSWGPATDNAGVTSFDYRVTTSGGGIVYDWTNVGNVFAWSIGGLTSRASYIIYVRARDATGNAGSPASQPITMPDFTPPPAPTQLSFQNLGSDTVEVRWLSYPWPPDTISQDYSFNGGPWVALGLIQAVTLNGLTPNTTYPISIRQRDDAGNVSPSLSGQFTTTEAWIPVANSGGQIVPSAAALYRSDTTCSGDPWPICTMAISKRYGNLAVVWSWTFDFVTPPCPGGWGLPGYRSPYSDCRVEASSTAYGQ